MNLETITAILELVLVVIDIEILMTLKQKKGGDK